MLLGPLLSPLAVAIRRSLPATASALGYHSVGTIPRGAILSSEAVRREGFFRSRANAFRSALRSNTTTASSDGTAAYNRLLSGDIAIASGPVPKALAPSYVGVIARYR